MRILGIDWGSSSIKAVEMDSAFGRYDIHDYHEHPIEAGKPPQDAVVQLLNKLAKVPDRIIIALPNGLCTFRNLQLPTRDKKSIQAAVSFELEDELPFPSEDSFLDYVILNQTKQGSAIHVGATLKRHLTTVIDTWKSAQVNPDVITTEAWAYRNLMNRVLGPTGQTSPVLLVQMGNDKTTLYVHWNESPAIIREIAWGGRDLNAAICEKFNVTLEQAEATKIDHGFVSAPSTHDPNSSTPEVKLQRTELSHCLEDALKSLIVELRQIALVSKNITRHSVSLVYLAGGSSLLPGISGWIEEKLTITTRPLLALSSITSSGVTYSDQTDARFLLAASLPLCLVGPDKATCINFRKKEFGKQVRSHEFNLRALRKPLMAIGTVAFCLFLSLIVQSSVYQSRLKVTDKLLEKSVRSFFGQISSSALKTYMKNPGVLRTSVTKELNKQRELSRLFGNNPHSPIEFLNTLSSSIPKDVVVDLSEFHVGSSAADPFAGGEPSASLSFIVANPQVAERLASILSGKISNIQRGKMEEVASSDNGTKKWKVTFSGKPTDDSYGK